MWTNPSKPAFLVCLLSSTLPLYEILSRALSAFCRAWAICSLCVNTGTNSRRESEWNAVSVHVDWNHWLVILYMFMSIVVTQQLKYFANLYFLLSFSFETRSVCELCPVGVGWLWLINFPDVFEQKWCHVWINFFHKCVVIHFLFLSWEKNTRKQFSEIWDNIIC